MPKKNATPSKAQQESIKKNGLRTWERSVLQDMFYTMIIRHRITGVGSIN